MSEQKIYFGKRFYDNKSNSIITSNVSVVKLDNDNGTWSEDTLPAGISTAYDSGKSCHIVEMLESTTGIFAWKIGSEVQYSTLFSVGHTHDFAATGHTHSDYEKATFTDGGLIIAALSAKQLPGGCILLEASANVSGEFTYFFEYWQTTTETATDPSTVNDTWWSEQGDRIVKQVNAPQAIISLEPEIGVTRKLYARVWCMDSQGNVSAKSSTISKNYTKNANMGYEALVDSITSRVKERLVITDSSEQACSISDKEAM